MLTIRVYSKGEIAFKTGRADLFGNRRSFFDTTMDNPDVSFARGILLLFRVFLITEGSERQSDNKGY
jgi:hypothetical protein